MGRNSRSRSTRRAHRESGRRGSPRRSPRERSPRRSPRGDSRYRSDHRRLQTDRFDPPSSWNSSDTHWDTKTEYGLNFTVVQSGIGNWGLCLVANGRFVSCEFFRNRMEATFATTISVKCQGRRIPWISTNYWEFSHHRAKIHKNGTQS